MDDVLRCDIDKFAEKNYENIFKDIARLVAINSVEGLSTVEAPFGEGPAAALKLALKITEELGLKGYNCEGKIGYALLGENTDRYLATIAHLDIVPSGEGWKADPFTMRDKEGWIIGRGVVDDKGPLILTLYALKYLKERDIKLKYPIRALLGVNEETRMADVDYYLENYPAPLFCFTPDADFPLCHGEKGRFYGRLISKSSIGNILDISGGVARNMIPAKARARVFCENLKSTADVEVIETEKGVWELNAKGIGGHASSPEETRNAIGILMHYILDNKIANENERKFLELCLLVHDDYSGKTLGIAAEDGLLRPLSIAGSMISVKNGHMVQILDSRYPTNTSGEKIAVTLKEKARDVAQVIMDSDEKPFYMSINNPAAQICLKAYHDVTGEDGEPETMSGSTYARKFPNAISFGPGRNGKYRPDFAGYCHAAEESASKKYLIEAMKVYILALLELEKFNF